MLQMAGVLSALIIMVVRQFKYIFGNAIRVTLADPFFLVLQLAMLSLLVLLASVPGFTYHEHMKLLREQSGALLFMAACLAGTFALIRVVTDDIRRGASPIVRSRPVSTEVLLAGKWLGVMVCVGVLHGGGVVGYLWMSEAAHSGAFLNMTSLMTYVAVIVLALIVGALRHYLLGGTFAYGTNLILVGLLVGAWLIRLATIGPAEYDWLGVPVVGVLFIAALAFAAFLLPIAVIVDTPLVLTAGGVLFVGGLVSEALLGVLAFPHPIAVVGKAVVPNWQRFWMADRVLESGGIEPIYVVACVGYVVALAVGSVVLAAIGYDRMEVKQ